MQNNYNIKDLSTEELKHIYLHDFIKYTDDYVQCCHDELIHNRGIGENELTNELQKIASGDGLQYALRLHANGMSEGDIIRFFQHCGFSNIESIMDSYRDEIKETKKKKANEQIIGGIILMAFVLILNYLGYEIFWFNIIPVSNIVLIIGGILIATGSIKRILNR